MDSYKIEDPRDPWQRARRMEVVRYAHELGHSDIVEQMPKDLMVRILRSRGVPAPSVPPRPIGNVNPRSGDTSLTSHHYSGPVSEPAQETVTVSAEEILARDWAAHKEAQAAQPVEPSFIQLRQACKAKGIKYLRTDKAAQLKARLRGEDPAQLGQ